MILYRQLEENKINGLMERWPWSFVFFKYNFGLSFIKYVAIEY